MKHKSTAPTEGLNNMDALPPLPPDRRGPQRESMPSRDSLPQAGMPLPPMPAPRVPVQEPAPIAERDDDSDEYDLNEYAATPAPVSEVSYPEQSESTPSSAHDVSEDLMEDILEDLLESDVPEITDEPVQPPMVGTAPPSAFPTSNRPVPQRVEPRLERPEPTVQYVLPLETIPPTVPVVPKFAGASEETYPNDLSSKERRSTIVLEPEMQAAAQALLDYIGDDECSEVLLNGPNECARKIRGVRYHCPEVAFGDKQSYHDVINEVILNYCDTADRIDNRTVLLEGQMELPSPSGRPPMLARVHVIAPPGVDCAKVTIAKKPRADVTLEDMVAGGTMTREMSEFLKAVARGRATFVVSGPTGSGKSTLLQAMTHYFDPNDRVVVVEETPELRLPLGDVVYLKATLERPGMNPSEIFTLEFWTKQANRMRMDRIIVGETRGGEMAEWLIAANSGAEGSATTVHAESPRRTLDKILALASRSHAPMSEDQLRREIAATVNIIVQCALIDGRHIVTGVDEIVNSVAQQTGQILSNPIFFYDRTRGVHTVKSRPSDEFTDALNARGVPLNLTWFRGTQQR